MQFARLALPGPTALHSNLGAMEKGPRSLANWLDILSLSPIFATEYAEVVTESLVSCPPNGDKLRRIWDGSMLEVAVIMQMTRPSYVLSAVLPPEGP